MKKLLALSLAVVMVLAISVTAFGTWTVVNGPSADHVNPGDDLEIDYADFVNTTSGYVAGGNYDDFDDAIAAGVKTGDYSISYTMSRPAKSAVESVKFDADEGKVVFTLKQNYTMSLNDINGKIELKPKSSVSSTIRYTYTYDMKAAGITYGYPIVKTDATDDADLTFNYDDLKANPAGGNNYITDFAKSSGTAKISWGAFSATQNSQYDDPDFYFEVKINSSGKMNLSYSTKVVKDISQKYEEAELDFISFPAAPSFDYTGTAKFFTDDEKYVYEIKDGGLVAVNTTYDDDEESYSFKTRTLGSYVISDVELDVTADSSSSDGDTTNPDTGANDFVNVAVALAVVSLAAAGAVVLKKK